MTGSGIHKKEILRQWVVDALTTLGGTASIVEVCRFIWRNHEDDLWEAGDLFYTWQYDVRWAATDLRGRGIMRSDSESPRGVWELAGDRRDGGASGRPPEPP